MKHFLSIVLRNQFNLFYRFGYTVIPNIGHIEFDGTINDEVKENIIKQFTNVTPFEYDEEYLILHFEKSINDSDNFIEFEIQELVAIYPLSQQAKTSIESKIDQRIRLEKPIFETVLPEIETEIERKEVKRAISALWKICKIDAPLDKYISDIGIEKVFNGLEFRKRGTKSNKIQNGNYWEYLIAYDRFDYFPNSTLGYFYDAGQVFAYSKGLPAFQGSGLHEFLEKLNTTNPTAKLTDIITYLETEEQLKKYVSQTTTKNDIKQYIVTPLYLMLRDEIRNSDDISQTKLFKNLDYLKKFEDSFNYVVLLLGAFFGYRKFYDIYYETLNLRFYKDFQSPKTENKEQQENVSVVSETEQTATKLLEEELEKNETETKEEEVSETYHKDVVVNTEEISEAESGAKIKEKKITRSSNSQQDNPNSKSDISNIIAPIIEEELTKQEDITLTDLAKLIKSKTGEKFNNGIIENVAKHMEGVEIIRIKPKVKGVKRKERTLFD